MKIARLLAAALTLVIAGRASATVVFDDFNDNEGHFGSAPNLSGTSVGEDATSAADHVTTDSPLEGDGHQKLVLVHDATATALRIRHLSGGGTVGSNISFTTSGATDGWIGYYVKTTATGWQTSINLDGPPGGANTDMDASPSVPLIADGEWHLYEFNLDATGWGVVPGIAGGHSGGLLLDGSHTIDSIYFRDLDGSPGPTATFFLDFVAHNSAGSVADLLQSVPEASSFLALGLVGLVAGGAKWLRRQPAV